MLIIDRRIGWAAAVVALAIAVCGVRATAPAAAGPAEPTAIGSSSKFQAVSPIRLADTRQPRCECLRLDDHTIRVVVAGRNGIGSDISSAAITITGAGAMAAGFVTVFPSGQPRPGTSVLNLLEETATSNSTLTPVGEGGAIDLYSSVGAQLIVDLTGTFTPAASAAAGRFRPTATIRLLDTRGAGPSGLRPGAGVTLPLPAGVDADAMAVAVNITSVGAARAGFLTGYAAGASAPDTSFMNPDGTGGAKAASTILPVSSQGFTISTSVGGHVIVDLVGWFTGESAATTSDGLFVPVAATRLLDTRVDAPRLWPRGTLEVPLAVSPVAALVTNVTAVNPDRPGYITAYPAGTGLPATSSINAPARNATSANLAITTASTRGTAYFASGGTELLVDLTGYFTGAPVAATEPAPPNVAPVPRVLMIGDSTLGGLVDVARVRTALRGFDYVLDAKPCRRLVRPSCTSRFTHFAPNTAEDAINIAPGSFDVVLIKAGYNDAAADFESAVARVVQASRAKGTRLVIWLTYSESNLPGSYNTQIATLHRLAGSPTYPDLVVADWRTYAAPHDSWYEADRVHLTGAGMWATSDYISRWVAGTSHLPCPVAWTVGGVLDDPCPNPDALSAATGTAPDLKALYGS